MNETINLFKKEISNYINVKFAQNLTENDIIFDIPKNTANGDYSTNCALKFAKLLSMNPIQLANMLKEEVFSKNENVERIDIAGPGFINLFLKTEDLASCINKIINEDEKYGYNKSGNGEKILVEYVSANPTGDLHVGHAKAAAWGDSVTRLLKMSGYDCLREYYINDAGNQINNLADSIKARYLEALGLESSMPEDGYHGKDIIEIGKKLAKENGDTLVKMKDEEQHQYFRKIGLEIELEKIPFVENGFFYEGGNAYVAIDRGSKVDYLSISLKSNVVEKLTDSEIIGLDYSSALLGIPYSVNCETCDVYHINFEKREVELYASGNNMLIPPTNDGFSGFGDVKIADEDHLISVRNIDMGCEVVFIEEDPELHLIDREILRIGCTDLINSPSIKQAVYYYNSSQSEYLAIIEEYDIDYSDLTNSLLEITRKINDGDVPDIYCGNFF